jgi:dipeptidyl aminopeptidase/acylaminoacyl peptidase
VSSVDAATLDYVAELWLVPVGGGETRLLASAPGRISNPRWSPDGRDTAFVSNRTAERPHNNVSDIYIVSSIGLHLRHLTNSQGSIVGITWSPDGSELPAWAITLPQTPVSTPTTASTSCKLQMAGCARYPRASIVQRRQNPCRTWTIVRSTTPPRGPRTDWVSTFLLATEATSHSREHSGAVKAFVVSSEGRARLSAMP